MPALSEKLENRVGPRSMGARDSVNSDALAMTPESELEAAPESAGRARANTDREIIVMKLLQSAFSSINGFATFKLTAALVLATAASPLHAGGGTSGVTELLSLRQDGTSADSNVWAPSMSGDGRWVTFGTSDPLLPEDGNGHPDVYAYDRSTDNLICVSTSTAGVYGNAPAYNGQVSSDGNFVAFESRADNLVPLDFNTWPDVYVKNLQTSETVRISNALGTATAANGASWDPVLSADGRYVAFRSSGLDLVAVDTNWASDIFRYDTLTGQMLRVSDGPWGEGNGNVWDCSISADGSRIAFRSWASNLIPFDTNELADIFVVEVGGLPQLVSRNPLGHSADGSSSRPVISADGTRVTFGSWATDIAGPYNTQLDVFMMQVDTLAIELVSLRPDGLPGVGNSSNGYMSADGRYVSFTSEATGIARFEGPVWNCYVRDMATGRTWTIGLPSGVGGLANGASANPVLSSDGTIVAFESVATNLAPGDGNTHWDTFVRVLHEDPALYCTSSSTATGCLPSLATQGFSSASSGAGFTIRATDVPNQAFGLLFYGLAGQTAVPLGGATLCVAGALHRTPLLQSGGSPPAVDDCSGLLTLEMNAFASGAVGGQPNPALTRVGQVVNVQFFGRDAGNVFLTNALEYVVGP